VSEYERLNIAGRIPDPLGPFKGITVTEIYNLGMYPDESDTRFIIYVYEIAEPRTDEQFVEESDSVITHVDDQPPKRLTKESLLVSGFQARKYFF
jgi:hypothetical protein